MDGIARRVDDVAKRVDAVARCVDDVALLADGRRLLIIWLSVFHVEPNRLMVNTMTPVCLLIITKRVPYSVQVCIQPMPTVQQVNIVWAISACPVRWTLLLTLWVAAEFTPSTKAVATCSTPFLVVVNFTTSFVSLAVY